MSIQKITTEKIKAKEGSVSLEITKDTEKGKDTYTQFVLSVADDTKKNIKFDDKAAKDLIKLFSKLFNMKPAAPKKAKSNISNAISNSVNTNPKAVNTIQGGTIANGQDLVRMAEDSALKMSGQKKGGNNMADKINNRGGDDYEDDFFSRNKPRTADGSSAADKINNMESL